MIDTVASKIIKLNNSIKVYGPKLREIFQKTRDNSTIISSSLPMGTDLGSTTDSTNDKEVRELKKCVEDIKAENNKLKAQSAQYGILVQENKVLVSRFSELKKENAKLTSLKSVDIDKDPKYIELQGKLKSLEEWKTMAEKKELQEAALKALPGIVDCHLLREKG